MTCILIIEDNKTNLSLMTYVLEKFGYSTCTATDGEEGLAVALREVPALIMCDMHMPHIKSSIHRQHRLRTMRATTTFFLSTPICGMLGTGPA